RRLNTQVIGFNHDEKENIDTENMLQYITPQDLKNYGLIPELIGRLPVLTHLEPLDKAMLISILTEPKNAILKQYYKLFELEGIQLHFTSDAIDLIAEKAIEYKLGARGLRSLCEIILTDAMFELPSQKDIKEFTVDKIYVEDKINKSSIKKLVAA
ncbi:MAG TPA: ATP-dependent Clp protease ATP-binding subunit ClpX, partial [Saprospiraceae bacterium]|nr:ATP-dependent Clp protease ATP-binding subunit ClpX [Saprospiraceae bacterium]